MGKLWDFMGKLRVSYGLRISHKILRVVFFFNQVNVMNSQEKTRYGKLWVDDPKLIIFLL